MIQYSLPIEKREIGSKQDLKELRKQNMIPCVAYGHGEKTRSFAVNPIEIAKYFHTVGKENTIINIVFGKKKQMTLMKDIQRNPKTYQITHIDFHILHKGQMIKADIPVILIGTALGVKEGGVLEQLIREVSVKVLPMKMPEHFEFNVEKLQTGESLHIRDIEFKDGEILEPPQRTICTILAPRVEEEETPEEEAAAAEGTEALEPEVIGEKKDTDTKEEGDSKK
ncbi:50S ribosomal protein L25 [candidate division WOR-3 bacterium]|nr:50S ribosomal protein L25 [candidate division WOR-3 bacterium]